MAEALFDDRLRLVPQPGTTAKDGGDIGRIAFYTSSVRHEETGEQLVSVVTLGDGMRLTKDQVRELRDWLGAWLDD